MFICLWVNFVYSHIWLSLNSQFFCHTLSLLSHCKLMFTYLFLHFYWFICYFLHLYELCSQRASCSAHLSDSVLSPHPHPPDVSKVSLCCCVLQVWRGEDEKWSHDKFEELDQAPKARDELVSVYGYDIRSEEGAPRARRRRRYGSVSSQSQPRILVS